MHSAVKGSISWPLEVLRSIVLLIFSTCYHLLREKAGEVSNYNHVSFVSSSGSINYCFIYFEALLLGANMFTIIMASGELIFLSFF